VGAVVANRYRLDRLITQGEPSPLLLVLVGTGAIGFYLAR